jgi:hypothetical protein
MPVGPVPPPDRIILHVDLWAEHGAADSLVDPLNA